MAHRRSAFLSTSWTDVIKAKGDDSRAHEALSELCKKYWYPLYAFLRKRGHGYEDAQDITQGFLASFLRLDSFANCHPENGKLRTYLLCSLRNYESNWIRNSKTKRSGGHFELISYEWLSAEKRFSEEPSDIQSPEYLYDLRWATTLMENSVADLQDEYRKKGKAKLFEVLGVYLDDCKPKPSYKESARKLGMTTGSVKMAVRRMRERRRQMLRAAIAATVSNPQLIDAEIASLIEVFGKSHSEI